MNEFEMFPSDTSIEDEVFVQLEMARDNPKKLIEILVEETQRYQAIINEGYSGDIKLQLEDMTGQGTDLYGWVLWVNRMWEKDQEGETLFSRVARIEISEVDFRGRKVKISLLQWLDSDDNVHREDFGRVIRVKPADYLMYLDSIMNTGNTVLKSRK